ncbi:uncharacterized protein BX663DRAFT_521336, partial [Cokeromyces recurvatus]|uniref:uncharacterized protein n=1 Tax=Cokeromyces recurvatus TaxID=90255 RepID=UPI0022202A41
SWFLRYKTLLGRCLQTTLPLYQILTLCLLFLRLTTPPQLFVAMLQSLQLHLETLVWILKNPQNPCLLTPEKSCRFFAPLKLRIVPTIPPSVLFTLRVLLNIPCFIIFLSTFHP